MLRITKLNAGYEDLPVLKNISLELEVGAISVLMGPNGAGKSTLIKSVFNLAKVNSGKIAFREAQIDKYIDITGLPTHDLLELGIAYVPQGKINFDTLTVEENLLIGAEHIESKEVAEKNLTQVYNEFPWLQKKKDEYAFALSGGQQQMLALGRALMNLPRLLLFDEPSLGLSPKLVKETFARIKEINESLDTTILIVEHNLKSVFDITDYGYVLMDGELVGQGTPQVLKKSKILDKVFVGHVS